MLTNLLIKFSQLNELFHCKYPVGILYHLPLGLGVGEDNVKSKHNMIAG
jgi:hypothetical protein